MNASKLRLAALSLAAAAVLRAQAPAGFVTVFGNNVLNADGSKANGTLTAQVLVSGSPIGTNLTAGGQITASVVQIPVVAGVFRLNLPDTSATRPQNVCVSLSGTASDGSSLLGTGYECVQPTSASNYWCSAGSCNLDNYIPYTAPLTAVQSGPPGATGTQGPSGCNSGTSCSADFYPRSVNGTQYATAFFGSGGSDMGLALNAAIAVVLKNTPGGGVVKGPAGSFTSTNTAVVPQGILLDLDPGFVLQYNGAGDGVEVNTNVAGLARTGIDGHGGAKIVGNSSARSGIRLDAANSVFVHGVDVSGFTSTAAGMGMGIWVNGANSVDIDQRSQIHGNTDGIVLLNANINGSAYSANAVHITNDEIAANSDCGIWSYKSGFAGTENLNDVVRDTVLEGNGNCDIKLDWNRTTLIQGTYLESNVPHNIIIGPSNNTWKTVIRDDYFTLSAQSSPVYWTYGDGVTFTGNGALGSSPNLTAMVDTPQAATYAQYIGFQENYLPGGVAEFAAQGVPVVAYRALVKVPLTQVQFAIPSASASGTVLGTAINGNTALAVGTDQGRPIKCSVLPQSSDPLLNGLELHVRAQPGTAGGFQATYATLAGTPTTSSYTYLYACEQDY